MKNSFTRNSLLILALLLFGAFVTVSAQMPMRTMNQVAVTGWADDRHYFFRTFDESKKPVIMSVDVKTGRSVLVSPEKSPRDLISQALPSGVTLGMSDVISPDSKSAVIVKDNDLYFFSISSRELKQLTMDSAP